MKQPSDIIRVARGRINHTSQAPPIFNMESIPNVESLVLKKVVEERKTHKQISDELKRLYPGVPGLSSRSVRRFCNAHDIHSMSLLTDVDLDRVVSSSIAKVRLCLPVL